jgi:hypothetical protein
MPPRKRKQLTLKKCRSAVSNGSHILAEVDARSAHMRRYRDLILAHESQLGEVSESESRLIRRAAMITLQLEMLDAKFANNGGEASALDLTRYQQTTGALRRLLETLGLQRRAKDVTPPSLAEYLQSRYRREPEEPPQEDAPP